MLELTALARTLIGAVLGTAQQNNTNHNHSIISIGPKTLPLLGNGAGPAKNVTKRGVHKDLESCPDIFSKLSLKMLQSKSI